MSESCWQLFLSGGSEESVDEMSLAIYEAVQEATGKREEGRPEGWGSDDSRRFWKSAEQIKEGYKASLRGTLDRNGLTPIARA
jgi:hypothetical protein